MTRLTLNYHREPHTLDHHRLCITATAAATATAVLAATPNSYGGRVTDDKDRLLLMTMLARCYSPELVLGGPGYALSSCPGCTLPADGGRTAMLTHIECLPSEQAPEIFGLHANAAISADIADAERVLSGLLAADVCSGDSSSSSGTRVESGGSSRTEDRVARLITDALEQLPASLDVEAARRRFPPSHEQSLNTVLLQEMARYNTLLSVLRESLASIGAALRGLQVMSEQMEAAYHSISLNQVCMADHMTSLHAL